jgi:GR25 family glycosyltransferase involved in LPS biosynthesis
MRFKYYSFVTVVVICSLPDYWCCCHLSLLSSIVLPGFTSPKCANWIIDRFNKKKFIQNSLFHVTDGQKRLGFVNPMQINQLELNPVINEKSELFKGMRNKKWDAAIKKAQQKLIKKKRDLASTNIGQLMQRFKDRECIMSPYNFD